MRSETSESSIPGQASAPSRLQDEQERPGALSPDMRCGTRVGASGRVSAAALSAASLIATDAFGLLRLHEAVASADSVEALNSGVAAMPAIFTSLTHAAVPAPVTLRVHTSLCDAVARRLVDFSLTRHGPSPVPFAWLAFGSGGRCELSLFSDQDNGLAYADTADPSADAYFLQLATEVNQDLARCGFTLDPHGVLATDPDWRIPVSGWVDVFGGCLRGWDNDSVMRAAVGFDVRQVAGDLDVVPALEQVIRQAPNYSRFLLGLAQLGAEIPSPLGFRRRVKGHVDLKEKALLPVQNLARYYACAGGVTGGSTLDRLAAVRDAGGKGSAEAESLGQAYEALLGIFARHQVEAFGAGLPHCGPLDTCRLRSEDRCSLETALRAVARVQEHLPRRCSL
jgi:CBS domain-containing protein